MFIKATRKSALIEVVIRVISFRPLPKTMTELSNQKENFKSYLKVTETSFKQDNSQ